MQTLTPDQAVTQIRQRFRDQKRLIYVAGCSGSPHLMAEAFAAQGPPADGQEESFDGVWIPGMDTVNWAELHETATGRSSFVGLAWRSAFEAGRFRFRPETYTQTFARFERDAFDVAFAMVTPPDISGLVSLGVSADFSRPPVENARLSIALINPHMPRPADGVTLPLDSFDLAVDAATALPVFQEKTLDGRFAVIGQHIAGLVEGVERPTLQLGLGNVQRAVLEALASSSVRNLSLHAGMISTPLLRLLDAGRIDDRAGAITCGVALGNQALYQRASEDRRICFREVGYTHAAATLCGIERLVAINSAIEVDLFGQANGEFMAGHQVSGGGGLTDFLAGAQASKGGLAVIALNATASGGQRSRIVPQLDAPAVTVARTLVDCVVTEHGVAHLTGLDLDSRAEALIAIAAPDHRDALADAWTAIRSRL